MKGFTLIELMVVLAIMAILVMFATPTLTSQIAKTQLKEALGLSEIIKERVNAYYKEASAFPESSVDVSVDESDQYDYVSSISVASGVITMTFKDDANTLIKGKTITFRPHANNSLIVVWQCSSTITSNDVLPVKCRS